jgi:integrase
MKRPLSVSKRTRNDRGKRVDWMVSGTGPGSSRIRRFFPTKIEAEAFADDRNREAENIGWQAVHLADEHRTEAAKCLSLLEESGHTLTEAVTFYLEHIKLTEGSQPVKQVVAEIMEAKASRGLSVLHMRTMRYHFKAFVEGFGKRKISGVTRQEIEKWLNSRKLPPASFRSARTYLGMLFNFAVKNGVAKTNPLKDVELPKAKVKPPGILTPAAMRCLIDECRTHHPDLLPAMLIQSFAGLRREECARLDWNEVRLDRGLIEVTAENSKTSQRRLVAIRPNLAVFLAQLRQESGHVFPTSYNKSATDLRRLVIKAGHKYDKNALRHSFASYHLAECQDAAKTAHQLGHKGTGMLFEHYRELVTPDDAVAWWAIMPGDDAGGNIVAMPAPAKAAPIAGGKVRRG